MRALLVPLVLFLLAPVSPAPIVPAEDEARFVLGVLRRDGVVLPFASFTGKGWESRWPQNLRWTELPLLLGDVPEGWWGKAGAPAALTVWSNGASRGQVQLNRPVTMAPSCERRLGLTSNYTPAETPPPPAFRPYPKDGLVTSGPQPIAVPETVAPGTRDFVGAAMILIDPVDQAEDLATGQFTAWNHPVSRNERKKVPIEIEALYRAPMDSEGWTAYHVEAVKRYAPGKDDEGCGLVTSVTGWISLGPDGKTSTELAARVTYCDRKGVAYFLPLGLMRLAGRTYWIYQTSGYQVERYFIVRPTPKETDFHVGYTAGSCGGL